MCRLIPSWRIGVLRVLGACVLAASQASCILVGYDGSDASARDDSDGGVVPDAGVDGPPHDGSVLAPLDGSVGQFDGSVGQFDGSAAPLDGGVAGVDAAADASPSDSVDSSLPVALDGSLPVDPITAEGGTPLPPADAGGTPIVIPGCMGSPALGLCWHLGAFGRSCDETCDDGNYGGFDQRTIYYTGKPSEGAGSLANCQTVLLALGNTTVPMAAHRPDGLSLGCHVWSSGATYWLDDLHEAPSDAGDSYFGARRACACKY